MDAPPAYHSEGKDDIYRPEVMKTIEDTLDELDSELRDLSLKIHGVWPHLIRCEVWLKL
jgi:hypothetical protein